jgi:signal recognition particle GTPase
VHEFGLPVKVVGVGVRVDDPRPFDPEDFGCPLVYS